MATDCASTSATMSATSTVSAGTSTRSKRTSKAGASVSTRKSSVMGACFSAGSFLPMLPTIRCCAEASTPMNTTAPKS